MKEPELSCQLCGLHFHKLVKLNRHYNQTHLNLKPFPCTLCYKSFKRQSHLARHQLSHSSAKAHSCNLCTMRFKYKYHLTRHIKYIHQSSEIPCTLCGITFRKKIQLHRHGIDVHGLAKPYTCEQCHKDFMKEGSLRGHRCEKIHPKDQKVEMCLEENCLSIFKTKRSLKKHKQIHMQGEEIQ